MILPLWQQLREAEQSHQQSFQLMKRREALELRELELEGTAAEEDLKAVKREKCEIDRLIDQVGEDFDEEAEALHNRLNEAILEGFPSQKPIYDQLQTGIEKAAHQLKALSASEVFFSKVESLLQKMLVVRQGVQRRGLLSYIFGANPNVVISQHLKAIELLIQSNLPKLHQAWSGSKNGELYREFIPFLKELHEQCTERWSFQHIDKMLGSALRKSAEFRERLSQLSELERLNHHKFVQELKAWQDHMASQVSQEKQDT